MERRAPPKPSIPPVGYRFHPNDAELVGHFLKKKILDSGSENMPIAEVKVCDFEPWVLPDQSKVKSNDKSWYFFCPRDFKYANSRRTNRKTKAGFWKPTGKPRKVKGIGTKEVIGTKRTLVFYENPYSKSVKTKWIMHEYESIQVQGNFVVCKLKLKPDEKIKKVKTKEMAAASPSTSESVMTVTSSCGEYEPNENTSADIEGHNVDGMADASTHENDKHSCSAVFDIGDPYSNEVTSCSGCDESEPEYPLIYGAECHNPNEMTATMTFGKQKFSGEEAYIFKGQNSDKNINMFCSEESEWSPFATSPDCGNGNQIQHVETDLTTPPVAADLEVNAAQPSLDVHGPLTFFDDMKMLIEPKGSPNSPLFTCNED
ncbi:NAC domain-containing protein 96-like isoform X2 [Euphorbia lathyris]